MKNLLLFHELNGSSAKEEKEMQFPLTSSFLQKKDVKSFQTSRKNILEMLGAKEEDQLHFITTHTGAVSFVFRSHYQQEMMLSGNQHIAVFSLDHAPILRAAENLKGFGCSVTKIKPNAFSQVTKDLVMKAITKRTSLVSLSWVHPTLSTIQPIYEISDLCKELGIALHLDISYAVGKLLFRFDEIEATYITLNTNSIGCKRGSLLLAKKEAELLPIETLENETYLSDYQECESALKSLQSNIEYINLEVARLRDFFEEELVKEFPEVSSLFCEIERLPNVSVMSFPFVKAEYLLYLLKENGLLASIGGGTFQTLDSSLQSLFYEEKEALSAISFTLPQDATQMIVLKALEIIKKTYQEAKKLSFDLFKEDA